MCKFCSCVDFFICCIQFTISDIVTDRSGKKMCILQNDSQGMAQIIFFDLCNVDSIVTNLTFLNIVETIDQVGDRCLSCTGRTYKCKFLTRFCIQADVMKDGLILIISKGHVFKTYIPFQFCIGYGTICGMWMFPCPHAGSFFAFCNVAVLIFSCIDKRHISFILFWFFINQIKDTFCSGKCHND